MKSNLKPFVLLGMALVLSGSAQPATDKYLWRYYRPGNTGIQGDLNAAIWIGADNDPWIAGADPLAQEGGVAKFVQAENRWVNVSNIDYPVIGTANDTGFCYINDMASDGHGNLWMATFRGALKMNVARGAGSLVRFGPENSLLPGGNTRDLSIAPDGTVWFSVDSTVFGGGGLVRYNPTNNTWTDMGPHGGDRIAVQPKPGGGFYVWCSQPGANPVERYDSSTGTWANFSVAVGSPAHLVSLDSVDSAGNLWMTRWSSNQLEERVDVLKPDGTWLSPALPPQHPQVSVAGLRAFGNLQALMVNGYGDLYRFNGSSWALLGPIPVSGFVNDLDIDTAGRIWACGTSTGGAFRRDALTGVWQRYRITNTSQFDLFNNDLTLDPVNGDVYACANAGPGYGGMVKFDGVRWTGFNNYTYGLGVNWPFNGDNSDAVYVRPSSRKVAVNPYVTYTQEWNGSSFSPLNGGPEQVETYEEDSLGRLWVTGHYGGLGFFNGANYSFVASGDWFSTVKRDPSRSGTVWANLGWEARRTDGANTLFVKTPADFGSTGLFTGLAVQPNGVCWMGIWQQFVSTGSILVRMDPTSGTVQQWNHDQGWPFPGEHVRPLAVTPDGRVWMSFDSEYPSTDMGLLWWDGTKVHVFPAPPNGEWRWGGLPHANISDLEVRVVPGGYELWMSCATRGLAVLKVQTLVKSPRAQN
ncbi:MAG: hypothetical protein JSS66_03240 [Armatimonadetes bacterium]|nr:hypothetical protein [Armatimonadota bacterium]